jgi:hypothetical protein
MMREKLPNPGHFLHRLGHDVTVKHPRGVLEFLVPHVRLSGEHAEARDQLRVIP